MQPLPKTQEKATQTAPDTQEEGPPELESLEVLNHSFHQDFDIAYITGF